MRKDRVPENREEHLLRDASERQQVDRDQPNEEGLEQSEGPRAPRGDALLDGSGSRHGVDERDQRPGEGG